MPMIDNPAYRKVIEGKPVVSLAMVDEQGHTAELAGVTLRTEPKDWLVRQGMDVMLVRDLPIPEADEERRFNTWIIRQGNREITRITVPLHVLLPNRRYTLSRSLCVPERVLQPE